MPGLLITAKTLRQWKSAPFSGGIVIEDGALATVRVGKGLHQLPVHASITGNRAVFKLPGRKKIVFGTASTCTRMVNQEERLMTAENGTSQDI